MNKEIVAVNKKFSPTNDASIAIFERLESEVRGYIRSFPILFDRGLGTTLIDADGREYLDFFAGAGALNYGHNNPAFKKPLLDYIERAWARPCYQRQEGIY